MPTQQEIVHAYRYLYRRLLRGVQHSIPARYVVRDQLRRAFREKPKPKTTAASEQGKAGDDDGGGGGASQAEDWWDPGAIRRTGWFLTEAAHEAGLEHKVLKNLVRMHIERAPARRDWRKAVIYGRRPEAERTRREHAFQHYDATVAMLNKSMGLCLR